MCIVCSCDYLSAPFNGNLIGVECSRQLHSTFRISILSSIISHLPQQVRDKALAHLLEHLTRNDLQLVITEDCAPKLSSD